MDKSDKLDLVSYTPQKLASSSWLIIESHGRPSESMLLDGWGSRPQLG